MDVIGAQEMLMPTIQSADIWRESGRYDSYGPEMMRLCDRHDREMIYGPTNEEMIVTLMREVKSYRELPQILYHIQWKFRDEIRPRFGVMRGREFLMKDAYSFDVDYTDAMISYQKMMLAYLRIFRRMGLRVIPMAVDTSEIGGNMSHEFIVLAATGESRVYYDRDLERIDYMIDTVDYTNTSDLSRFYNHITGYYSATDEKHNLSIWENINPTRRQEGCGIEVGYIFYFGTKYSEVMKMSVTLKDESLRHPEMGSYGIGVSRLVGALIEANHDDAGIIWPDAVAPFRVVILNLKQGDAVCDGLCTQLYTACGGDALLDDRDKRAGIKFADADLMGHPWQVIVGGRSSAGMVEVKCRSTGIRTELSPNAALELINR